MVTPSVFPSSVLAGASDTQIDTLRSGMELETDNKPKTKSLTLGRPEIHTGIGPQGKNRAGLGF